jgi:hypothetical protein
MERVTRLHWAHRRCTREIAELERSLLSVDCRLGSWQTRLPSICVVCLAIGGR